MAATILEDTQSATVPLSLRSSSLLPSEADDEESISMLDWQAMLSPSRRSCIKLSHVEPCVNKAVAHLTILKDRLAECVRNQLPSTSGQVYESQSNNPRKSILVQRDSNSSRLSSGRASQLIVEGITTGIPIEKQNKSSMKKVTANFVPSRCQNRGTCMFLIQKWMKISIYFHPFLDDY